MTVNVRAILGSHTCCVRTKCSEELCYVDGQHQRRSCMVRFAASAVAFIVLSCYAAFAQNPPASNPQALSYATKSIATMVGSVSISDVTMTGSVTWNGSDTGAATLKALGTGESRMDLALSSGTRTEIRDAQTGVQLGQWFSPNDTSGKYANHN